jgi:hypothetical protein
MAACGARQCRRFKPLSLVIYCNRDDMKLHPARRISIKKRERGAHASAYFRLHLRPLIYHKVQLLISRALSRSYGGSFFSLFALSAAHWHERRKKKESCSVFINAHASSLMNLSLTIAAVPLTHKPRANKRESDRLRIFCAAETWGERTKIRAVSTFRKEKKNKNFKQHIQQR